MGFLGRGPACSAVVNLADAINPAGWKSPQQIEQSKTEVWEEAETAGENYGFLSHSQYGLTKPPNPYRKITK